MKAPRKSKEELRREKDSQPSLNNNTAPFAFNLVKKDVLLPIVLIL